MVENFFLPLHPEERDESGGGSESVSYAAATLSSSKKRPLPLYRRPSLRPALHPPSSTRARSRSFLIPPGTKGVNRSGIR